MKKGFEITFFSIKYVVNHEFFHHFITFYQ